MTNIILVSLLSACTIPIGTTTTERKPIVKVPEHRGWHYEKDGHRLEMCDARAVAGVPRAEQLMHRCARELVVSRVPAVASLPAGIVALVSLGTHDRAFAEGAWITFGLVYVTAIALQAVFPSGRHEAEAVRIYNDEPTPN